MMCTWWILKNTNSHRHKLDRAEILAAVSGAPDPSCVFTSPSAGQATHAPSPTYPFRGRDHPATTHRRGTLFHDLNILKGTL